MKLAVAIADRDDDSRPPMASWEETGIDRGPGAVAETADRLGYHHLTCSEHIGLPAAELDRRGARYWDPLATFGYLAARTSQIRFATHVLVLGYHHPLEIAKRYGTLDVVSGGRVILGVGVGSLAGRVRPPRRPVRRPRRTRRRRPASPARLAVPARARLSRRVLRLRGLRHRPAAVQEHLPIWVGGRTLRSLRRAVTLADGWNPFSVPAAQAKEWLARVDVPAGFEVILPAVKRVDPIAEPTETQEILAATADVRGHDHLRLVPPPVAAGLPRASSKRSPRSTPR